MKSSVETLEGNKVKLYIEVDEAEFERDLDQAFKTIAREVNLPGFRNGKAPRKLLEARIGVGAAREQALRDSIPVYLGQAVREHDVDLIATPEVEITDGQESGPVEFEAECEVRPTITVPGYASLRVEIPAIEPESEAVEAMQQEQLRASGSLVTVDRAAAEGDYLTIDLATKRDGEEVTGLNTEDWSYEIGQGWVTDDFDSHLVGASAGDVIEFTSTPKGTEEPADFTVKVTAVQELDVPELTDEWVSENIGEFDTVEEWTASVEDGLRENNLEMVRRGLGREIVNALTQLVDTELPDSMVQAEMRGQLQNLARQFQQQGVDLGQWLASTGQDPADFMENARPQAEQAVRVDLALRAVAAAEELDATDQDIEVEYARMAMQTGQKAKEIRRLYESNDAVADLIAGIRKAKAVDWLAHHVEFVDPAGNPIDRDLVLGHTDHDHDHDGHDHDDHDHDGHDHDGHDHS